MLSMTLVIYVVHVNVYGRPLPELDDTQNRNWVSAETTADPLPEITDPSA